jgi:hypothetical protein
LGQPSATNPTVIGLVRLVVIKSLPRFLKINSNYLAGKLTKRHYKIPLQLKQIPILSGLKVIDNSTLIYMAAGGYDKYEAKNPKKSHYPLPFTPGKMV